MVWDFGESAALAKTLGVERLTPAIVAIVVLLLVAEVQQWGNVDRI